MIPTVAEVNNFFCVRDISPTRETLVNGWIDSAVAIVEDYANIYMTERSDTLYLIYDPDKDIEVLKIGDISNSTLTLRDSEGTAFTRSDSDWIVYQRYDGTNILKPVHESGWSGDDDVVNGLTDVCKLETTFSKYPDNDSIKSALLLIIERIAEAKDTQMGSMHYISKLIESAIPDRVML